MPVRLVNEEEMLLVAIKGEQCIKKNLHRIRLKCFWKAFEKKILFKYKYFSVYLLTSKNIISGITFETFVRV